MLRLGPCTTNRRSCAVFASFTIGMSAIRYLSELALRERWLVIYRIDLQEGGAHLLLWHVCSECSGAECRRQYPAHLPAAHLLVPERSTQQHRDSEPSGAGGQPKAHEQRLLPRDHLIRCDPEAPANPRRGDHSDRNR